MGYRVNITVNYAKNDNGDPMGVELQANSHHPDVNFASIVAQANALKHQPTAILRLLLSKTYPTSHGSHQAGAPVFHLGVPHPDADVMIVLD